eukprot:gene10351-12713_t
MYSVIETAYPCTRIMTEKGQIGCSSKYGGNSGTLYLIDSDKSYKSFFDSSPLSVIVTLDANYFNKTIVESLEDSRNIDGMIVLTDLRKNYAYSPDYSYPLKQYGLYPSSKLTWNPNADEFAYQDFDYPIFALDANNSSNLRKLSLSNREGKYPLWGAQLDSFMQGSQNAETCLRRTVCEPLGGKSVWSSFSPSVDTTKDIVMVMIPMDTTAFFHDLATGADATSYTEVVLLSMLEALSHVDKSSWKKEVIFALWDTEKWGYQGSTKFVDDIRNFHCNNYGANNTRCLDPNTPDLAFTDIDFSKIKTIIEFNQIGLPVYNADRDKSLLYLHTNPDVDTSKIVEIFTSTDALLTGNVSVGFEKLKLSELPPSSAMSFLKQSNTIPTIIVTDHAKTYSNPYYGSHLDTAENVNVSLLFDTIQLLATTIDRVAGGNNNITVNQFWTQDIFQCLLNSFSCKYVETLLTRYPYSTYPSYYTSVYGINPNNQLLTLQASFFKELISILTASVTSQDNCSYDNPCSDKSMSCVGSVCIKSNTHYHDSISLGFDYDNKSGTWKIVNSSYPIFVESNWDYTFLRIYQHDSHTVEVLFLVGGLIEFFVTIGIIFFLRKRLSKKYKLL